MKKNILQIVPENFDGFLDVKKEHNRYKLFRNYTNKIKNPKIVYYPCMAYDVISVFNATNFDKLYAVSNVDYTYDNIQYSDYFKNITKEDYREYFASSKKYLVFNEVAKITKNLKYLNSKDIQIFLSKKQYYEFVKILKDLLKKPNNIFSKYIALCFINIKFNYRDDLKYNNIVFNFNLKNKSREIIYYFEQNVFHFNMDVLKNVNIFFTQGGITFEPYDPDQDNTHITSTLIDKLKNVKIAICNYSKYELESIKKKYNVIKKYKFNANHMIVLTKN